MAAPTIAIPTYIRPANLEVQLNHLSGFVGDSIEILVGDNASLETTPDVCHKAISFARRIRYFRNLKNLGYDGNIHARFEAA
jgi:GT2 family glycosyltransferase